jgi:hypothetical protein
MLIGAIITLVWAFADNDESADPKRSFGAFGGWIFISAVVGWLTGPIIVFYILWKKLCALPPES